MQLNDFSATQAVDRQQQQQGTVSQVDRFLTVASRDQTLNLFPRRTNRQGFLGKDPRCLNRRRQTGATPIASLCKTKERPQRVGIGLDGRACVATLSEHLQQRLVNVPNQNLGEGLAEPRQDVLNHLDSLSDGAGSEPLLDPHLFRKDPGLIFVGAGSWSRQFQTIQKPEPLSGMLEELLA